MKTFSELRKISIIKYSTQLVVIYLIKEKYFYLIILKIKKRLCHSTERVSKRFHYDSVYVK
jgi:hypothetical protein